ncbi:MAG: hypothetical protein J6Y28_08980 [Acholeplasmatales bacterium]|nr:hypothetical protein [Acholeplasmatales bacterium]
MKRVINFYKDATNYIFKENDNKLIEISVTEKILNGSDLYISFFKDYNIEDTFEIIDKTSDDEKKNDKMCIAIYTKVKELLSNIENMLKLELRQQDDKTE